MVCDIEDYNLIIDELNRNNGEVSFETRKRLAAKAFERTFSYDLVINRYLIGESDDFGNSYAQSFIKVQDLRYGENPHQKAAFYSKNNDDPLSISNFVQIQGKELSFNNFLDIDATISSLSYFNFKRACAVVVKHTNPCGAAYGNSIYEAFEKAWNGDALAAFGGIVGVNRKVDENLANQMLTKGFFEVLICPEISDQAREVFKEKKNLRIMVNPALFKGIASSENDFKHVRGGLLIQGGDVLKLRKANLKVATKVKPTSKQVKDMLFAWQIARVSKSNTIVLVKNEALVASGVGQQDRKRCCELAASKAGQRSLGSVCASDAFFPFSDGPEILIRAGVSAIIQPGGSIRDQETIDLCNKHKITMVFTGVRCFKH